MTFFDCTADLVGQLNGMDRKECYRLTHPLLKISGYATDGWNRLVAGRATYDTMNYFNVRRLVKNQLNLPRGTNN